MKGSLRGSLGVELRFPQGNKGEGGGQGGRRVWGRAVQGRELGRVPRARLPASKPVLCLIL